MIYENPIIFIKFVREAIVRKNFTTKNIMRSITFLEF